MEISKGKYIKPIDFYIKVNSETVTNPFLNEMIQLRLGVRKALKIILNVRLTGILFIDVDFIINSFDASGRSFKINFGKSNGKKQYDGTYIFTIDISKIECFDYIKITKNYGRQFINLNNLSVEFEDILQSIDYKSYKAVISNFIN